MTYADVTTNNCGNTFSTTRTWTATDACGNTSSASQTINVVDNTAPVISGVGSNGTVSCPASPVFSAPVATDACGTATLTYADVTINNCGNTYSTTRTWTATDACGNTSLASQTITATDNLVPTIATNASVYLCYEDANPTLLAPASSDACNSVVVTRTGTNNYPVGLTTVTWTSTDACGNASSSTQSVRRNAQINASFAISALPGYCQGANVNITITSTGGTGNHTYLWSNGSTTATVAVPNNATYTCTVTDSYTTAGSPSNCSRTFVYAANLNTANLLASYVILGATDVHVHGYNTILHGGIGATESTVPAGSGSGCAGGRVKLHQHSTATAAGTFLKATCIQVDATSTASSQFAGAAASPSLPVFDAGVVVPNNATSVTVTANTNVTLSGVVYGNITIKQGATLTFLHASIDCKNIKMEKGAKLRGDKPCTRIRMEGILTVGEGAIVNPKVDAHEMSIYVDLVNNSGSGGGNGSGGSGSDGNASINISQSAQVKAFIYAPNGKLEVHGPGGNGNHSSGSGSGIHSTAAATQMVGLFIAKTVNAHGRTTWDWNTNCVTCNYTLRDGDLANSAAETLRSEESADQIAVTNYPDPFSLIKTLLLEIPLQLDQILAS